MSGTQLIRAIVQRTLGSKVFHDRLLKNVEIISADNGNLVAEFTVGEEHLNEAGTLHGGCTSTLVDTLSTYGLITKMIKGQNCTPGVSIDLHVTFTKAASPGEVLVIDSKTIKAGRTLAFLEIEIKKKNEGSIVARGTHTKFIGGST